jgi:hypothetical protein
MVFRKLLHLGKKFISTDAGGGDRAISAGFNVGLSVGVSQCAGAKWLPDPSGVSGVLMGDFLSLGISSAWMKIRGKRANSSGAIAL